MGGSDLCDIVLKADWVRELFTDYRKRFNLMSGLAISNVKSPASSTANPVRPTREGSRGRDAAAPPGATRDTRGAREDLASVEPGVSVSTSPRKPVLRSPANGGTSRITPSKPLPATRTIQIPTRFHAATRWFAREIPGRMGGVTRTTITVWRIAHGGRYGSVRGKPCGTAPASVTFTLVANYGTSVTIGKLSTRHATARGR